jgi:hypothetical protein
MYLMGCRADVSASLFSVNIIFQIRPYAWALNYFQHRPLPTPLDATRPLAPIAPILPSLLLAPIFHVSSRSPHPLPPSLPIAPITALISSSPHQTDAAPPHPAQPNPPRPTIFYILTNKADGIRVNSTMRMMMVMVMMLMICGVCILQGVGRERIGESC